jgi:hypothetical protein
MVFMRLLLPACQLAGIQQSYRTIFIFRTDFEKRGAKIIILNKTTKPPVYLLPGRFFLSL